MPAALELAQHGFADHALALGAHKGFDGQPALRCSGNDRQIAQTFQRHAHGARNGGGREREHIHLSAHGLHGFFVAHAKTVFFINDEQTQVFELDRAGQQLVRAHHDVYRTFAQPLQCSVDFFGGAKA